MKKTSSELTQLKVDSFARLQFFLQISFTNYKVNGEVSLHYSHGHLNVATVVPCSGDVWVESSAAGVFKEAQLAFSPVEGNRRLSVYLLVRFQRKAGGLRLQ